MCCLYCPTTDIPEVACLCSVRAVPMSTHHILFSCLQKETLIFLHCCRRNSHATRPAHPTSECFNWRSTVNKVKRVHSLTSHTHGLLTAATPDQTDSSPDTTASHARCIILLTASVLLGWHWLLLCRGQQHFYVR